MRMRTSCWSISRLGIYVILLLTVTEAASAATVRGQLLHVYPNGQVAVAAGYSVTVFSPATGMRSSPFVTGRDGMYYVQNVPAGTYNLEVWTVPNLPPGRISNSGPGALYRYPPRLCLEQNEHRNARPVIDSRQPRGCPSKLRKNSIRSERSTRKLSCFHNPT
jgi:hypothetical protein